MNANGEAYEALDLVQSELSRRFDQTGMKTAALGENTVIDAANSLISSELDAQSLQLPNQLDTGRLHLQLQMLGDVCKGADSPCETVQEVASHLSNLHRQTRALFGEVEDLIKLCMCLPISVASSERTFSTLRRLKTWLRSSMSQKSPVSLCL